MPFGITNGVACFQRLMNNFKSEEELDDIFAFMDNITICDMSENDHDENLVKFWEPLKCWNLTFYKRQMYILKNLIKFHWLLYY